MLRSDKVIKSSGVQFGTSGARGLVEQFTVQTCAAFTVAFIDTIKKNFDVRKIAVAIDNRPSSPQMARACISAAKKLGIDVTYYGVLPTPALAFSAMQEGIPCIMVTGSHIPFDRNGLKFYRPDGEISKQDELAIVNAQVEFEEVTLTEGLQASYLAAEQYIARYTSFFGAEYLQGKRIGIYLHSSAGRDLYPRLFRAFGAEVVCLDRTDQFVPIDTEAVSLEDKEKAKKWVNSYQLDCLFSTDGDGDRPLVSDENGNWLKGDILGLLCASAIDIEAVAIPVSCNSSVDKSNYFKHVSRTKIGSPFVIAEFDSLVERYTRVGGFEANGGFLLGSDVFKNNKLLKALPTRDAILPVLSVLSLAQGSKISELARSVESRFTDSDRIQNFPTEKSKEIISRALGNESEFLSMLLDRKIEVIDVNTVDGLRMTLVGDTVIHLRPSGNAPELRCYVEASTAEKASELVALTLEKLRNL